MKILKVHCLSLLALLLFQNSRAQQNNQEIADELYSKHAYYKAIEFYKIISTKDSTISCSNRRKLAMCYVKLHEIKNAEKIYREILTSCKTDSEDLRNFARILQSAGEYEKAKKLYSTCYETNPADTFSFESMHFCDTVKKSLDEISEVYLENLYHLNSTFDDVLDDISNDTIYFLTARKSRNFRSLYNGQYEYNRFVSYASKSQKVKQEGRNFRGFSTTDLEGKDLYYSELISDTGAIPRVRSVIYRIKKKDSLTEKSLFTYDDGKSNYSHPCISPNGLYFFFISDKEGGMGGTDIYYCTKTGNKWSSPINAGKNVNTVGNELFPFYMGEGYLIFSSEGRPGFGGFDLFATVLRNGICKKAVNLGFPINSRDNDVVLKWDRIKKTFYLSSDRTSGKGAFDIYKLYRFSTENIKKLF